MHLVSETDIENAWLAGILEGEACFDFNYYRGRKYPRIRVTMCDRDILEKIKEISGGTASIREENRRAHKENWSAQYSFQIANRKEVVPVLKRIRPYMGERRAARIDEILAYLGET
jgi:hypothetical protein